jgi:2-dehydro-3-deoxy-D-arabinonate dehydratase
LGLIREGLLYDLAALDAAMFGSIAAWLRHPRPVAALQEAVARLGDAIASCDPATGIGNAPSPLLPLSLSPPLSVAVPLDTQEVWAAGVTYLRSKEARMEESREGGSFYDRVYDAERPEIFFKATPSRVVGPGEPIRIRQDARWNVPEPEVALVVSAGLEIVGYTAGNDVSSRDIEGENPLYLPQAKVYRQCCALGPAILVEEEGARHRPLAVKLTIERAGRAVFSGETSTGRMKRQFRELVEYLGRDNLFPDGVFLLTGTGIVPPDEFTLEPGDLVSIEVPEIGTLRNTVVRD